jgi:hypothetical protein
MTIVYLNLNCKGVAAILPAFLHPFIKTRHESGESGGGVGGMRVVGLERGRRNKGKKRRRKWRKWSNWKTNIYRNSLRGMTEVTAKKESD